MKIAVIDSGSDINLFPEITKGYCFIPGESSTFCDDNGHGSHCISTILHHNPYAEIIPIKVLDSNLRASSIWLAEALNFLCSQDVNLIHLSLSFPNENHEIYRIINKLVTSGKIVIASYSNKSGEHSFPAEYSMVYGVVGGFFGNDKQFAFEKVSSKVVCSKIPVLVKNGNGKKMFFSGNSKATAVFTGILSRYLMECKGKNVDDFISLKAIKENNSYLYCKQLFFGQEVVDKKAEDNQLIRSINAVYTRYCVDFKLQGDISCLFSIPNYVRLLPEIIEEVEVQYGVEIPLFLSILEFKTLSSWHALIKKLQSGVV